MCLLFFSLVVTVAVAPILYFHLCLLAISILLLCSVSVGCGIGGCFQAGARAVAEVVDGWLRKYHYSLGDDFLPLIISDLRAQVPRALKV